MAKGGFPGPPYSLDQPAERSSAEVFVGQKRKEVRTPPRAGPDLCFKTLRIPGYGKIASSATTTATSVREPGMLRSGGKSSSGTGSPGKHRPALDSNFRHGAVPR